MNGDELLEVSDLIVDYDITTLRRRPVDKHAILAKLRGAVVGLEFGECQPGVRRQGRLPRPRGGVGELLNGFDRCRRQRSGATVFERRLPVLAGADQPITVGKISRDAFALVFLTTCRDEEEQCRPEADSRALIDASPCPAGHIRNSNPGQVLGSVLPLLGNAALCRLAASHARPVPMRSRELGSGVTARPLP